jgi:hypothetical protein
VQLLNTEEWTDGEYQGNLGEVLIRCNNVLYVRGIPEDELKGADGERRAAGAGSAAMKIE